MWEGIGDWKNTATYWLPLLWPSALCLYRSPGLLNRRPGGSAFCWVRAFSTASCHQRVSKLLCVPRAPSAGWWLSLPHLVSNSSDLELNRGSHSVIFWPSTQPQNIIPRWYTGRKWHIPMASNRKRSRGRIKAYDMGQGEGLIVPLQSCTGRE